MTARGNGTAAIVRRIRYLQYLADLIEPAGEWCRKDKREIARLLTKAAADLDIAITKYTEKAFP